MKPEQYCTGHRTAEARFICDRCRKAYCSECRCELLDGRVCCTECAVEAAGENGGVFAAHHGAGFPEVSRSRKRTGGKRFLTVFLLLCIPLLALEGLFLLRSTARTAGAQAEERRVMSDTLVLVTVLNRYRAEAGGYPDRLEQIVPAYWDRHDMAELQGYEYRRIGSERFVLRPRLSGRQDEDAGIVRALALIPQSLDRDTNLDVFLRAAKQSGRTARGGAGP